MHIVHDLVLLQADKLEAAIIQRTPDCSKDVKLIVEVKLITPKMSDDKVLLNIYHMFVLSCAMCNGFILYVQNILYTADNDNNLACLVTWC